MHRAWTGLSEKEISVGDLIRRGNHCRCFSSELCNDEAGRSRETTRTQSDAPYHVFAQSDRVYTDAFGCWRMYANAGVCESTRILLDP